MKAIAGFFNQHRFLSNFWESDLHYDGLTYGSAEAAYQAAKSDCPDTRAQFTRMSPYQAKQAGKTIPMRTGFEQEKRQIMEEILRAKFATPQLKALLLNTHPAPLIETNHWGDRFWGISNGAGANYLGLALMKIRNEFINTHAPSTN